MGFTEIEWETLPNRGWLWVSGSWVTIIPSIYIIYIYLYIYICIIHNIAWDSMGHVCPCLHCDNVSTCNMFHTNTRIRSVLSQAAIPANMCRLYG